jgi:hypothetical protein
MAQWLATDAQKRPRINDRTGMNSRGRGQGRSMKTIRRYALPLFISLLWVGFIVFVGMAK